MENASKALIIAGAILLSILIIGLGMFIYQQAAGTVNKANLDPQAVAAYNADFESYEGTRSGSQAIALCNKVINHNTSNVDDASKQITVVATDASADFEAPTAAVTAASVNEVKNNLRSGYTYKISFGRDPNSGYITQIGIVRKTGSATN